MALHMQCVSADLVLLPLCAGLHWNLLVLEKTTQQIRVYDSLEEIRELHRSSMDMFLMALQVCAGWQWIKALPSPEKRANHCRQANADCGVYCLGFIEEECRRVAGKVPWSEGHVVPEEILQHVLRLAANCVTMETKLQKWLPSETGFASGSEADEESE